MPDAPPRGKVARGRDCSETETCKYRRAGKLGNRHPAGTWKRALAGYIITRGDVLVLHACVGLRMSVGAARLRAGYWHAVFVLLGHFFVFFLPWIVVQFDYYDGFVTWCRLWSGARGDSRDYDGSET